MATSHAHKVQAKVQAKVQYMYSQNNHKSNSE